MEQHLLSVRGLEVVYHTQEGILPALHDVSFDVRPGEIVGIVGESGCGKSTVASALLRLLPPNGQITAGQLLFKDDDLIALGPEELRELRGHELAMIFQDPMTSLNPVFTIGTQMLDVGQAHPNGAWYDRDELRRKAVAMLDRIGIPDAAERIAHFPHQFSGGMRQRIMIAMALMLRPALLIADEPTSALDVTLEAQILELMKGLRQTYQTAILFISHDLGVIAQLCDRVIVMYAGRVVEQGDVFSIFERPQHPYTQALLASVPSRKHHGERLVTIPGRVPSLSNLPPGCKFADRCPHAQATCQQHEPRYLRLGDRHVRCHIYDPASGYEALSPMPPGLQPLYPPQAVADMRELEAGQSRTENRGDGHGSLIALNDVSTYFYDRLNLVGQLLRRKRGAVRAVDEVSLNIPRGEVIGLVGESGSGKTTLGKTILRLVPLTGGQISYDGQDITHVSSTELRRLRARMQMIFQDPYSSLSPRLRVSYLLTEPYTIHGVPPADQYSVAELLAMVGLSTEQAAKYPHELSGGQARRVGIARALALRPEFLVADEPTSGLDVSVAASILNLMKDLAQQLGLTYLIITHNLNVVGYISNRVAVMYLGKLVEVGATSQIFESPAHPYTLALLSAISEPDPRQRRSEQRLLLSDEIPSPKNPPPGCRFHTRCPFAEARCKAETPPLEEIEPGHKVACHFWLRVQQSQVAAAVSGSPVNAA
jgi:oligopeptide/dipeptide ABC transporter ATP-binding protein